MYGDLLSEYPVQTGSVWEFERGRLVCGSALNLANWVRIPKVQAVYTDPPWNDGNMKMFYNYAHREIEKSHMELILGIMREIKDHTAPVSTVTFDMGIKITPRLLGELEKIGWMTGRVYTTYYGTPKRPCRTICGSFHELGIIELGIEGKHGINAIEGVMRAYKQAGYSAVLDPCCGKLDYLVSALEQGIPKVYGIELIPEKLALGLRRLEKLGFSVRRIQ